MKCRIGLAGAVIAAAFVTGPAAAAPLGATYSSFWALGDSLSDNGNLFAATGGAAPSDPPYLKGRFSNGPVWAEGITSEFLAAGRPSANFAFGGAKAQGDADGIPDLADQIGFFTLAAKPVMGALPLVSLLIGPNDLFAGLGALAGDPGATPIAEVGFNAATALGLGAQALAGLGVSDFLIFNLPDLGLTPAYLAAPAPLQAAATAGTLAYNAQLDAVVAGLRGDGLNVSTVDLYGLFARLRDDPLAFGVSDVITPCIIPGVSVCTPDEAAARAFFDPVHPNALVHAVIGDAARAALAPVPLPASAALLIAGFCALFAARIRRAA